MTNIGTAYFPTADRSSPITRALSGPPGGDPARGTVVAAHISAYMAAVHVTVLACRYGVEEQTTQARLAGKPNLLAVVRELQEISADLGYATMDGLALMSLLHGEFMFFDLSQRTASEGHSIPLPDEV